MHRRIQKAGEIVLFALIIVGSVLIFVNREQIQELSPATYFGVFVLCFLCNASVLLPAPSLLVVANCALFLNPILVSLAGALGATGGEFAGYLCGNAGRALSPHFQKIVEKIAAFVKKDVLLVFVLAVLPLPLFDFVGLYSGGNKMPAWKFSISCFLGKFLKMLVFTQFGSLLTRSMTQVG